MTDQPSDSNEPSYPVKLFVYDLSRGMARSMSLPLTGRQIDGIWHTSIVAWDREYFFGQGISVVYPGTSHHGAPLETFDLGTTSIDRETFDGALLPDLRQRFRAQDYNLLSWNCNNFTQEVAQILTGADIPAHIRSLPQDFLSTPFGQMLQPQIDAMFRHPSADISGPPATAPANSAANNLLNQVASRAYAGNTPVESPAPTSANTNAPIRHITTQAELAEIRTLFPCVAVLFTSQSCPPCRIVEPVFEDLAHHYHVQDTEPGNHKRIAFVRVESNAATLNLFSQAGVSATPTIQLIALGKQVNQIKGADPPGLKSAVASLLLEVYPPHPHASVSPPLKSLSSLPRQPHTYLAKPRLDSLLQKVDATIAQHPCKTFGDKADLQAARKIVAAAWLPWLDTVSSTKASPAPTSSLVQDTSLVVRRLSVLPIDSLFPILDLFRLSVPNESFVRTAFAPPLAAERNEVNGIIRLLSLVSEVAYRGEWNASQRPLLLTSARLLSNLSASTTFVEVIESHETIRSLTLELTTSLLLCPDAGVRSAAATCAFNLALHQHAERSDWINRDPAAAPMLGSRLGETWESELASALLQAIANESESEETLHRLLAALTLHIHLSQFWAESVGPMLQVLDAQDLLAAKRDSGLVSNSAKKQDLAGLLDDLVRLVSCNTD
ncbi:hypothetical protein L1887_59921 [Cichorium endivia]|nr:hypothetical protein L1887_59921 [Cichorium endivia]